MSKITLANLASLSNATTAINTINSNGSIVQTAMDNTLSRDGTAPNQMSATLDMNNSRIINLPAPISLTEPIKLSDLNSITGGSVVQVNNIPTGGTIGQALVKNSSTNLDAVWANPIQTANDTNVTLAVSASNPQTLTAGWTGTLANARLANMAANTVKGNNTGSPAVPVDLTQTQLTAMVNNFTTSLPGSAPASGGGTLNYLRADGTWTTPPATSITFLLSGTSTYSAPAGTVMLRVTMVGGGGGGGANVTNAGGIGGTTSWAFSGGFGTVTAPGGTGGPVAGATNGGAGGSGGSSGGLTTVAHFPGQAGGAGSAIAGVPSGAGGNTSFGGAGASVATSAGLAAAASSGSGGSGAGNNTSKSSPGGGAGEYVTFWCGGATVPSAFPVTYTVGAAGTGGAAGTVAGGNGAAGIIIVEEYYI